MLPETGLTSSAYTGSEWTTESENVKIVRKEKERVKP